MPNSGMAAPRNRQLHRFSLACRPGAANAQIWYSQTGEDRITPAISATFTRRYSGSSGPFRTSSLMPSARQPECPRIAVAQSGRSMTCQAWVKKMNPAVIPAARASAILTTRLRSSRR